MKITGNFERFQYFNFETKLFWKNVNLFQKTGVPFLVESTKIDNRTFPYKLLCLKPMLRQIEWGKGTKWTYHKELSFASNYLLFSKVLFQFKNLVYRVDLMYRLAKCPYIYFSKALKFYLRVLFPVSILKPKSSNEEQLCLFAMLHEFNEWILPLTLPKHQQTSAVSEI